jgi:alpha-tubulin suppressor-like RCC1 family protein
MFFVSCPFIILVMVGSMVKVSAGFTHSLAISQKGQVYSWGEGGFYQLGHGNKNDVKTPKKI